MFAEIWSVSLNRKKFRRISKTISHSEGGHTVNKSIVPDKQCEPNHVRPTTRVNQFKCTGYTCTGWTKLCAPYIQGEQNHVNPIYRVKKIIYTRYAGWTKSSVPDIQGFKNIVGTGYTRRTKIMCTRYTWWTKSCAPDIQDEQNHVHPIYRV